MGLSLLVGPFKPSCSVTQVISNLAQVGEQSGHDYFRSTAVRGDYHLRYSDCESE